jgi:hypothetical protein
MRYASSVLTMLAFSLVSCRTVKEAGESTALVAGVATMVAVSPAIPVVDAIRNLDGREIRGLSVLQVYRVDSGVYLIPNVRGWFIERSGEKGSMSAWMVDLRTAVRDEKGRIVLDWTNLRPSYSREFDRSSLESIPAWTKDHRVAEYFRHERSEPHFELYVEGKKFILILKQEKEPNQSPEPTSGSVTPRASVVILE